MQRKKYTMNKIQILAICPYAGMRDIFEKLSQSYPDMEIEPFLGDLEDGLKIAEQEICKKRYDYIISRGGTAELIAERISIPLLEIPISVGDTLQAIKMVENTQGLCAVVGFPDVTSSAETVLQTLGGSEMELHTVGSAHEAEVAVQELKDRGIQIIIGDTIATSVGARMGLGTILITSCMESIVGVINQIQKLHRSISRIRWEWDILRTAMLKRHMAFLVLDGEDKSVLCGLSRCGAEDELKKLVLKKLPEVLKHDSLEFYVNNRTSSCLVSTYTTDSGNGQTAILAMADDTSSRIGRGRAIELYDDQRILEDWNPEYEDSLMTAFLTDQAEKVAGESNPTIIIGERGTGKRRIAYTVYRNGVFQNNAYCIVDMSYVTEKDWSYFLASDTSPLNHSGMTICFLYANLFTITRWKDIQEHLLYSNLSKRNQLLFCYTVKDTNGGSTIMDYFLNNSNGRIIYAPSLREKPDVIQELAAIQINNYNRQHGTQIIGFEKAALATLMKYDWPGNLPQLRRVLHELIETATQPYLQEARVQECLDKEDSVYSKVGRENVQTITMAKHLDGIVKDVIHQVLIEENMNKKRAAERLGISRTTLWRLSKSGELL